MTQKHLNWGATFQSVCLLAIYSQLHFVSALLPFLEGSNASMYQHLISPVWHYSMPGSGGLDPSECESSLN